jgi:hypothetical protein
MNMKTTIPWIFLLLVSLSPISNAALIYHFSGQIKQIEYDDIGLIATKGLEIGSPVEYTFLVDFNRQATITHYDGSIEIVEDFPPPGWHGNLSTDIFYADFLGGDIFRDELASQTMPTWGAIKNIQGNFTIAPHLAMGSLNVNGNYYYLSIFGDGHPSYWSIGEQLNVFSSASNLALQASVFRAAVTLDRVSTVPVPAALGFMSFGLSFLGGFKLFQRKRLT